MDGAHQILKREREGYECSKSGHDERKNGLQS